MPASRRRRSSGVVGLAEWFARRDRQVRGESPDARSLWFAYATQQGSRCVSRLPSARRGRRRCPCRVSAPRGGREARPRRGGLRGRGACRGGPLAEARGTIRNESPAGSGRWTMIDVTRGSTDCAVAAVAPPLGPAGGIRGDVMSNHELAVLGDRARPPCRSLRAVHRASRDRAFCGRAFRDLQTARRTACIASRRVPASRRCRADALHPAGETPGPQHSIRRAWSMPASRRRPFGGEVRAKGPAGPRGEARGADSVVHARDAAAVEARVASAVGATK
jgi:hypothetical protein